MTVTGKRPTAIVMGAGVAGMAVAVRLADHGVAVTLLEATRRLGGRACSFPDKQSGFIIDNCPHVLLGCCDQMRSFLGRIGSADKINFTTRYYFSNNTGGVDILKPGILPAPLHFTGSMLLGIRFLTIREKTAIARAMLKIYRSRPGSYYDISFAELLHKWKQPPGAVAKFWDFFIRSTCNAPVQQVAAEYALMVFRMAFLAGPKAAAMGISEAPLSETYKNVNAIIEKSQGRVVTGERVTGFSLDEEECLSAVITSKNKYKADIYISALPRQVLLQLSEKYLPRINSELKNAKFESSPIICAHLWFKQTVMPCPHLALPGRETEWIFDRTRSGEQGQYLCALRSAADSWVKASEDEIITKVMSDLREALPGTAIEDPYRARVIKEKRATFIPAPGLEKHRPDTFTNINNLFIAGDFCRTGWPATMESAVRSGNKAARAAIRYLSGKNGD